MDEENLLELQSTTEDDLERAIGVLKFFRDRKEAITRIIGLVQENPEFFGAEYNDSCLEKAAEKLEQLVEEWKASK
jgi:hypothetical protein